MFSPFPLPQFKAIAGRDTVGYKGLDFLNEYSVPVPKILFMVQLLAPVCSLKGLCHEIDFKNFDKNLQN